MLPKTGLITVHPQFPASTPVSTLKALPDAPGCLVDPWALLAPWAAFESVTGLLIKDLGTGSHATAEHMSVLVAQALGGSRRLSAQIVRM